MAPNLEVPKIGGMGGGGICRAFLTKWRKLGNESDELYSPKCLSCLIL